MVLSYNFGIPLIVAARVRPRGVGAMDPVQVSSEETRSSSARPLAFSLLVGRFGSPTKIDKTENKLVPLF